MNVVINRRRMQTQLYDLFDLEKPTATDGRSNFESAINKSKLYMSTVAVGDPVTDLIELPSVEDEKESAAVSQPVEELTAKPK